MKSDAKRDLASHVFIQNGDMPPPRLAYPLMCFDVLGRCPKNIIFGHLPDGPTNQTNRAVERQSVEKVPPARRKRQVSGREGPLGTTESMTL